MKERKKAKAEAKAEAKGLAMRLAVFSDVHGNLVALEAVLADIEAQGGVDGAFPLLNSFSCLNEIKKVP